MQRGTNQRLEAAKSQEPNLENCQKKLETEITPRGEFKGKAQRESIVGHPLKQNQPLASHHTLSIVL